MMNPYFDLSGKKALVTGGAGGIGLAAAEALYEAGADVVIADCNAEKLSRAVDSKDPMRFNSIYLDVSSPESISEAICYLREHGGVDIFVNSAAIIIRKKLCDFSLKEWDRVMSVNLKGAFLLGKSISSLMIEQKRGGKMIFIVSTGAYRASIDYGVYSASKAGVVMLMKTFALELAQYGILCNAIAPTATETDFTADIYSADPARKASVAKNHPLGRIAVPDDYKGTIMYLASSASDFVTGTLVTVDGGKTAK